MGTHSPHGPCPTHLQASDLCWEGGEDLGGSCGSREWWGLVRHHGPLTSQKSLPPTQYRIPPCKEGPQSQEHLNTGERAGPTWRKAQMEEPRTQSSLFFSGRWSSSTSLSLTSFETLLLDSTVTNACQRAFKKRPIKIGEVLSSHFNTEDGGK